MTEMKHAHSGLPEFHIHGPDNDLTRAGVARKAAYAGVLIVLILLLGLANAVYGRWSRADTLSARAQAAAILHVLVVQPTPGSKLGPQFTKLRLPGTLLGLSEAQIYARSNGYVKQWLKDIGEPVKKGEALALLDLPEVAKQVDEAEANYQLAKKAFDRWTRLRAEDAVSQQELDEKTAAYRQTEATLKRLREQLGFGQVVAPFDGIVTRRNVNVGDLVNAGNTGTAQAMFAMARVDKLHVYAFVPQDRASDIRVGDSVELLRANAPDKPIVGRIARTAGAIDNTTRTLQVDIEVDNADRALMPGTYVDIVFKIDPSNLLVLPTNTLLFSPEGPQVATVKDGTVTRKAVKLGIDYGQMVQVRSGVEETDQIITSPPDSIADGQKVIIETPAPKAKKGP